MVAKREVNAQRDVFLFQIFKFHTTNCLISAFRLPEFYSEFYSSLAICYSITNFFLLPIFCCYLPLFFYFRTSFIPFSQSSLAAASSKFFHPFSFPPFLIPYIGFAEFGKARKKSGWRYKTLIN